MSKSKFNLINDREGVIINVTPTRVHTRNGTSILEGDLIWFASIEQYLTKKITVFEKRRLKNKLEEREDQVARCLCIGCMAASKTDFVAGTIQKKTEVKSLTHLLQCKGDDSSSQIVSRGQILAFMHRNNIKVPTLIQAGQRPASEGGARSSKGKETDFESFIVNVNYPNDDNA